MRRLAALLFILVCVCVLDGYIHYKTQEQMLKAMWERDVAVLQRDLMAYRLANACK